MRALAWIRFAAFPVLILTAAGCGDDGGGDDAGGGTDAGIDSGIDAGFDAGIDAGFDAGFDAAPVDGGIPDSHDAAWDGMVPVCNPETGIECDGDWEGRCSATCGEGSCCAPRMGDFECVPRDAMGRCPAADIWVDDARIRDLYEVEWAFFADDDCALVEGCVDAPGWRRLLRFDTWTPNTGTADLYLGVPDTDRPPFVYSDCHRHFHFDTYAEYDLLASDGSTAAEGHKQAFCLLDFYQYPGTDDRGSHYTCGNQGIQMGWQDVYGSVLDCQWVDVTEVAPGDYSLRIRLNVEQILNESDYTNNQVEVPITIPEDIVEDVTMACPAGSPEGSSRSCGLTRQGAYTCTPGAMVSVGCSAMCMLGSCTGDPFIRICEPDDDPTCAARNSIASNDDSGCGTGSCGRGGDCCSRAQFMCPTGGQFVVFHAPYDPDRTATCTVAVTGAMPMP